MAEGVALLLLFGLANYGAELVAWVTGESAKAWDYVLQGTQAAALWTLLAGLMPHILVRSACALGTFEAMQRPVCRLMFPMDRPPQTGGLNLCEAAVGLPVAWVNALAALFVAVLAQEVQRDAAP
jgi:hypothetical protein